MQTINASLRPTVINAIQFSHCLELAQTLKFPTRQPHLIP